MKPEGISGYIMVNTINNKRLILSEKYNKNSANYYTESCMHSETISTTPHSMEMKIVFFSKNLTFPKHF